MTETELKKMSREELLELLIAAARENEALRSRVEEQEKLLAERTILKERAGSIAEAALQLNGVFEAAQNAATQYLDSIRVHEQYCRTSRAAAERAAAAILSAAQAQAEETRKNAEKQAESYWAAVSARLEALYRENPELRGKLWDTER